MKGLVLFCDDWQGLFVDGKLIDEDHELVNINDWIKYTNTYGLTSVVYKELMDNDVEYLNDNGSFPKYQSELKGKYFTD